MDRATEKKKRVVIERAVIEDMTRILQVCIREIRELTATIRALRDDKD